MISPEDERILTEKRESQAHSFDARPLIGSSLADISISQFYAFREKALAQDTLQENNRTDSLQLASLGFYDIKNQCLSYAGLIAFGHSPRNYLKGHYIQYLRFDTEEKNSLPVDQKEIFGDLLSVLREVESIVSSQIKTELAHQSMMQEKLVWDYPPQALRELIYNAIMHRDYESNAPITLYWFLDRIEIQNPGGLYGRVELDNLGEINDYRNPIIADTMKTLGYVNKFGFGITRARKELETNGNPPPVFATYSGNKGFIAKIFRRTK